MKPFSIALEIFREYTNNTKFILAFLTSLIFLFSGLLCYEHRASSLQENNDIIGYITYKTRVIKRKSDSTVVWYDVEDRQPLTRRDTIRADELSDAVVRLNDGTELRIGENTMVVLDFSGKNIKLDFKYGSIQSNRKGNGDSKLEIISAGTKIDLKDGDLSLNKKENGALKVFAERGQAVLKQGAEEVRIEENSVLESKENEKPTVRQVELVLLQPESMKFFSAKGKSQSVFFTWKNSEKENKLEISKDSDFHTLHYAAEIKANSADVNLPTGSYYWRIKSKTDTSEPRKFTILEDTPLIIRSPKEKEEVIYTGNPVYINFSWSQLEDIKQYSIETAADAGFRNIVKKQESKTNSISSDFINAGIYYYRVKAEFNNPDLLPKISEVRSFIINEVTKLSPPVLLSPANGDVLNHKERILLNWKAIGYDSYLIRISADANFTSNLLEKNLTDNYILLPDMENNKTYYWSVEGTAGKLNQKNISNANRFTVKEKEIISAELKKERDSEIEPEVPEYTAPILLEPKSNLIVEEGKTASLKFSWKKQKEEVSYVLFIYRKNSDKEELLHKEAVSGNFIDLKDERLLTKGEYIWILESKYKDKDKKLQSKKSVKRNYTILPALTPPKIKKSSDIHYLEE